MILPYFLLADQYIIIIIILTYWFPEVSFGHKQFVCAINLGKYHSEWAGEADSQSPWCDLKGIKCHYNHNHDLVMYEVPCHNCNASYVGETGRRLQTRINEHKDETGKITEETIFNFYCHEQRRGGHYISHVFDTVLSSSTTVLQTWQMYSRVLVRYSFFEWTSYFYALLLFSYSVPFNDRFIC